MIIDDMTEVNVKEQMPSLYSAIELAYNKGLKKDKNFSENAVFVIFNSFERNPDSNGARLELNYAKCKGKEIFYED